MIDLNITEEVPDYFELFIRDKGYSTGIPRQFGIILFGNDPSYNPKFLVYVTLKAYFMGLLDYRLRAFMRSV